MRINVEKYAPQKPDPDRLLAAQSPAEHPMGPQPIFNGVAPCGPSAQVAERIRHLVESGCRLTHTGDGFCYISRRVASAIITDRELSRFVYPSTVRSSGVNLELPRYRLVWAHNGSTLCYHE